MPDQPLGERLIVALGQAKGPASVVELLARCHSDTSRTQVQLALDALVRSGKVERLVASDPEFQRPYFAYRLLPKEVKP